MTDSVQARYEALYLKTFDGIARRVAAKVRNHADAEDIVARGFTKLWKQIENGFADDLGARLNAIIESETLDHWRRELPRREHETHVGGLNELAGIEAQRMADGKDIGAMRVPALTVEDAEFRADFDRALRGLNEEERDAFILTDLRGLPQREAADILGVDQATVSRRADIARSALRKELS